MLVPFNQQLITTGDITTVNDPSPFSIQSLPAGIPAIVGGALGVGTMFYIDHIQAGLISNATNVQYGGYYQYVKASTALVRGDIVAWDAAATGKGINLYTVTHTITAVLEGQLAGFALGTVTSGNYTWIQVGGLAWVTYRASVTDTTAGDLVLQLTTTATADAIADATGTYISGGVKGLKNIIGTAYDAPANGGTLRIVVKNIALNI